MNYFNKALETFSTNVVNPIYYVFFSTATIFASLILFQGMGTTDAADSVSLICGFLVIFMGVYLLNLSREPDAPHHRGGLEAGLMSTSATFTDALPTAHRRWLTRPYTATDPRQSIGGRFSTDENYDHLPLQAGTGRRSSLFRQQSDSIVCPCLSGCATRSHADCLLPPALPRRLPCSSSTRSTRSRRRSTMCARRRRRRRTSRSSRRRGPRQEAAVTVEQTVSRPAHGDEGAESARNNQLQAPYALAHGIYDQMRAKAVRLVIEGPKQNEKGMRLAARGRQGWHWPDPVTISDSACERPRQARCKARARPLEVQHFGRRRREARIGSRGAQYVKPAQEPSTLSGGGG
jgi:hypothetical protein